MEKWFNSRFYLFFCLDTTVYSTTNTPPRKWGRTPEAGRKENTGNLILHKT
jgi:hypothetical protein